MLSKMTILILVVFALGMVAQAQDFKLAPGSPLTPWPYTTADIESSAVGLFPAIIPFPALALRPMDNISAFSYGGERMTPNPGCVHMIYFSVSAATTGIPGTAVGIQAAGNGAAGDIFVALVDPLFGPSTGPIVWKDAPSNGLTPLPTQDVVNGISYPKQPATTSLVYFTLDAPSAAFYGFTGADIFYTAPGTIYALFWQLGLVPADEIDALALVDNGIIGTLDPLDTVFISLTPASPSAAGLGGPASIIQVYPTVRTVYFNTQFGLFPTDDIDAITFYGPGGNIGCGPYLPGDINGDGLIRGGDVTFLVRYLKGISAPPPYECYDVSHKAMLYSAGDLNGDCLIRGSDVTRLVSYFKGISTILYCPWTPPCGI